MITLLLDIVRRRYLLKSLALAYRTLEGEFSVKMIQNSEIAYQREGKRALGEEQVGFM